MIPVCLQVAGASPQPQPASPTSPTPRPEITTRVLSVNFQLGYTGASYQDRWINGAMSGVTVAYSYGHFGVSGFVNRFRFSSEGIDTYMGGLGAFYANNWEGAYLRAGLQLGVGNTEFPPTRSTPASTVRGDALGAIEAAFGYAMRFGDSGFRLDVAGISTRVYVGNHYTGFDVSGYLDLGVLFGLFK